MTKNQAEDKEIDYDIAQEKIQELPNLLEIFIDYCGLDNMEACKQAQKLLDIINDK